MAYEFVNQLKANAIITNAGTSGDKFKLAGVNGKQTNADNFQTAILGLLHVVGKDSNIYSTGRAITQDVKTESSGDLTVTPLTFTAESFGGREEYDEQPYNRVAIRYPQGAFSHPTITCAGNIPIESENIGLEEFDDEDFAGANLKILRSTEAVTTGDDTLTFTVTVAEGTKSESVTVTITGASGSGYAFTKSVDM